MDTKPLKKKRYIIYTRCSTDEQAQGDFTTLDAQAYHCKNMIDAFGHEMADFGKGGIIYDDGYSGKDLNRPGIQSALNDILKQKSFDGIVFFRLDRLTRNPRDLYALIDLFKEHEIDFISVRENLDSSTAIGRVVIGILGLLSAFERELTGERVKASCIARARQGKWVGGSVPFGYKLIDDGSPLPNGRQPHKLAFDEAIGPALRTIWQMAAENKSLTEIGTELTRIGVPTPQGKLWRRQCVASILK
ncbi:MAG: recombinase family protein, partial [Candidatus Omnitrophota bacterium]|nr:recombinase family protein [Candidatus Omnitrophota bacterium]